MTVQNDRQSRQFVNIQFNSMKLRRLKDSNSTPLEVTLDLALLSNFGYNTYNMIIKY